MKTWTWSSIDPSAADQDECEGIDRLLPVGGIFQSLTKEKYSNGNETPKHLLKNNTIS